MDFKKILSFVTHLWNKKEQMLDAAKEMIQDLGDVMAKVQTLLDEANDMRGLLRPVLADLRTNNLLTTSNKLLLKDAAALLDLVIATGDEAVKEGLEAADAIRALVPGA